MSNRVINLVYGHRFGSGALKAVALRLADVARDDGTRIYPSLGRIARETEFCERAVRRSLRKLEAMGVLVLVSAGGGRNKPSSYRFDLDAIVTLPATRQAENPAPGAPFVEETRHLVPENPAPGAPNPLLNPYYSKSGDRTDTPPEPEQSPPARGAIAPTSKLVWDEAISLLSPFLPDSRYRSLIGKWAKRTRLGENPDVLHAVILAAKRASTADPVAYIEAALAKSHPLPPDPASLNEIEWSYRIKAAIARKEWFADWGPKPGERKCHVPTSLITPQLLSAVSASSQRTAA